MKTISTIAYELRQSNPEIGRPTAQDLNNMLIVKGLITSVADGKRPTAKGRQIGIQIKNGTKDDGTHYCCPEYNERAERYVKDLAIRYFAEIIASTELVMPEYLYTHKAYDYFKKRNRDHLVILEAPDAYWTYRQDAKNLCGLLSVMWYRNKDGVPGYSFHKNKLQAVLDKLDFYQMKWVVCGIYGERRSADFVTEEEPVNTEPEPGTVCIGSFVTVRINDYTVCSFYIRKSGRETDGDEIGSSITDSSPAGRALIGKKAGDIVTAIGDAGNTITYQILELI